MSITLDALALDSNPNISNMLGAIWEIDQPFINDFDEVLFDDAEYLQDKEELIEEIKADLEPLKQKRGSTRLSKGILSSKSSKSAIKPQGQIKQTQFNTIPSRSDDVDIETMSIEDLLEKIRCKCRGFHEKYKERILQKKYTHAKSSQQSDSTDSMTGMPGLIEYKMTPSFVETQQKCFEFQNVKDIAINFIDNLLIDAKVKVAEQMGVPEEYESDQDKYAEGIIPLSSIEEEILSASTSTSEMGLLLIKDFTPKNGKVLILHSIQTWHLKKEWSYCIKFIQENSDACSDFYVYEVIWSLPTMSYPIPQVTASVFYTIEVSRVKPRMCPVKVTYNFETERCKFKLEDDIQHERFLNNILKCKISFFKTLRM